MAEFAPGDPLGRPQKLLNFINGKFLPPEATVDDLKKELLTLYDGYSWDGEYHLLNPWSVFEAFEINELGNFWFTSGTPSFLNELAHKDFNIYEIFQTDTHLKGNQNAIDIGNMKPLALLFQSGYLTVDHREVIANEKRYYLRFPNLEVQSSIYQLTLGLEDAIKTLSALKIQAEALWVSLSNLDPEGAEEAFSDILCGFPPNIHSPYERYYQVIFLMALGVAGHSFVSESRPGEGFFDVQLQTANGDNFIIEMKYVSAESGPEKPELTQDELNKRMEEAAQKALAQIEAKKYARKFRGQGNNIYKTALVIGDQTDVLVVFEKAENWHLVRDNQGLWKVQKK
jgi:hypothetical protein